MEVELYVYDLSKGLARQMSAALLGVQIDAIYHTSLIFGGIEYFFGAGIQTSYPGATHHGAPIEKISLGETSLPEDVILEYIDSLKQIYTVESYDLFVHNCNNFSNDLAMFLVGRGIPDHIVSLPQTVLNTPFGQMLRPQIDSAMRSVTQAPVAAPPPKPAPKAAAQTAQPKQPSQFGIVHNVTSLAEVESLLKSASKSCAVIFFTSSTCPPCKIVYPAYDELAAEAGDKAVLIKVDTNRAFDVSAKYGIRATPTFMTFLKGSKEEQWSGADEARLRGTVRLLIQMAWPPHPHSSLNLPALLRSNHHSVTYSKVPPLEKLSAKLGHAASEPSVLALQRFISARQQSGAIEAPLPDLRTFSAFFHTALKTSSAETLFPLVDLFRVALVDPRFSGYFAEGEANHKTIVDLFQCIEDRGGQDCPYSLRLVTLQAACNLFTSPLFQEHILPLPEVASAITQLTSSSLLDDQHSNVRVAAASLAFNVAAYCHKQRIEAQREVLGESEQVELLASLLEAIGVEAQSEEAIMGLLLAVGLIIYAAPTNGEVLDLCKAMDAAGVISAKKKVFPREPLVKEIGEVLLFEGV
ncbi:putative thioredoxin [Xylona heveae TC161]|uniref:Putative thioredoxin n=1 Tax=Xylona heveae (strain CBS 132557 / TC161) TaxID=1328760 RepID=A0A165JTX4_XYLHT|nr:putative thioredoxin [Xylona heveae TC161]KZF26623.1 putative thioredoxin [Xylona heveae TC161]